MDVNVVYKNGPFNRGCCITEDFQHLFAGNPLFYCTVNPDRFEIKLLWVTFACRRSKNIQSVMAIMLISGKCVHARRTKGKKRVI